MSEESAFLRAIQANPTDTTAKLVYADWLDEHGESEKAQYVRTEVTMFALGRLQGFLSALELCSHHAADLVYTFTAELLPLQGAIQDLVGERYQFHRFHESVRATRLR